MYFSRKGIYLQETECIRSPLYCSMLGWGGSSSGNTTRAPSCFIVMAAVAYFSFCPRVRRKLRLVALWDGGPLSPLRQIPISNSYYHQSPTRYPGLQSISLPSFCLCSRSLRGLHPALAECEPMFRCPADPAPSDPSDRMTR